MSGHKLEATSIREDRFIAGVVAGKTLTQATIDAGYAAKNADVQAQRLVKRPRVAQAINATKERIAKQVRVTVERTLEELAVIGFSDIRHYTVDGKPIADWLGLTPDAPYNAMRAIKKIKRKPITLEVTNAGGKVMQVASHEFEIEFWSKDTATKHLGEYLKLFKEKRAEDDPDESISDDELRAGVISIMREARKRRDVALGKKHTT